MVNSSIKEAIEVIKWIWWWDGEIKQLNSVRAKKLKASKANNYQLSKNICEGGNRAFLGKSKRKERPKKLNSFNPIMKNGSCLRELSLTVAQLFRCAEYGFSRQMKIQNVMKMQKVQHDGGHLVAFKGCWQSWWQIQILSQQ